MLGVHERLARAARVIGTAVAVAAFAIAVLGLAGLAAYGVVGMDLDTAFGFILCGLSLRAKAGSATKPRSVAELLTALAVLVAILGAAEYFSAAELGVDRFAVAVGMPAPAEMPRQMSPLTVCGFLLFAVGSLAPRGLRGDLIALATQSVGMVGVVLLAVETAYGISILDRQFTATSISIQAVALFAMLFLGQAMLRPQVGWISLLLSPGSGGHLSRRMTAIIVAIPIIGWLRLQGEAAGLFDTREGLALFTLANIALMSATVWYSGRRAEEIDAERKKTHDALVASESQLREGENRYRSVVSLLNEGVFIQENGQITYANARALDIAGVTSVAELVGRRFEDLFFAEDREEIRSLLEDIGGTAAPVEMRLLPLLGSEILVSVQIDTFFQKIRRQTVITVRDITAERNAELRARESQKLEAIGQLTGGIAHDFNNILTVITSKAEYLAQRPDPTQIHGAAAAISHAAEQAAALVQQLLMFARKQRLTPESIDVARHLEAMLPLIRRTIEANIEILLEPKSSLPAIAADPGGLQSAILNLCLNAADAMPTGGKLTIGADEVLLMGSPDLPAGEYVIISVSDTGIGMGPDIVRHAFEPFFTTKPVGSGTGLGLSGVYGFARESGGHAVIDSESGEGTMVRLFLPVAPGATADRPSPSTGKTADHDEAGKVLIVEDNDLLRETLFDQLERLGYVVIVAKAAAEALVTLEHDAQIDLVISDVIMPGGMNGADLVREISRRRPHVGRLLMSGYTARSALGKIEMPADVPLLSKPYTGDQLRDAVRAAISARQPVKG